MDTARPCPTSSALASLRSSRSASPLSACSTAAEHASQRTRLRPVRASTEAPEAGSAAMPHVLRSRFASLQPRGSAAKRLIDGRRTSKLAHPARLRPVRVSAEAPEAGSAAMHHVFRFRFASLQPQRIAAKRLFDGHRTSQSAHQASPGATARECCPVRAEARSPWRCSAALRSLATRFAFT